MIGEAFIRNSDNQIRMVLTEDDDPLVGNWTALDIHFGGVTLHRTADGDGVSLDGATGLLTITPADLDTLELDAVDELRAGRSYRVEIVVTSVLNDNGVVFGGPGSDGIFFIIGDKPGV